MALYEGDLDTSTMESWGLFPVVAGQRVSFLLAQYRSYEGKAAF